MDVSKVRLLVTAVLAILSISTIAFSQSSVSTTLSSTLCSIFNTIKSVIFILGITLIVLGAALYAAAHLTPERLREKFTEYGYAMILGGIVGVIIALLALPILNIIVSAGGSNAIISQQSATSIC
ncbi:MAG: hypothetical protein ARM1_0703 [Candidatus Micrarchaeota archaeon]|nr:MAG: hypothetical protein ARM1_0703 [Candidatus Micrarchaeota archaeon]